MMTNRGLAFAPVAVGALALAAGCMTRPVVHEDPTLNIVFTANVAQSAVDKVDLLFMIDNSRSMGDKQDFLKEAIPDLIARLVTPNCVDTTDPRVVLGVSHDNGVCDKGKPEFPPVHDMHIGVLTSSLGTRLGNTCKPDDLAGANNAHNDDRAHLIDRGGADEHPVADLVAPSSFLAWFPTVPANQGAPAPMGAPAITDAAKLQADFADLIGGVNEYGCGIESQLESWYRFLVQPDPYDHLELDAQQRPVWVGIDSLILQQRHDFLRPDSLVAIVTLTDENDSEIDVRALGGSAYKLMDSTYEPPRATVACDRDPNDPGCTTCDVLSAQAQAADANCAKGRYSASNDWGMDMNLRHVHMKQKYGVDAQFPLARYVDALTNAHIPNRDGTSCVNPLFAASLPDGTTTDGGALCNLKVGGRTKDQNFFAHIGGVPSELLHFTPNDPTASALTDADWQKILGKDPAAYDTTGIDPHMIESGAPRPGLAPPSAANDADPVHGREWVSNAGSAVDVQYACTFPLVKARNCADPANSGICDCPLAAGLPHEQIPSVCDATDPTKQTHAKAYPTVRELALAKALGAQGIVSSICPIHVTKQGGEADPLYGYRPAVASIVEQLKSQLDHQCVPRPLVQDPGPGPTTGEVPCLVLETLAKAGPESDCNQPGLSIPASSLLQKFREQQRAEQVAKGSADDLSELPVCQVNQLGGADLVDGSCELSSAPGWCYVKAKAGTCSQVLFSASGNPHPGARVRLQCIEGS